MTKYSRFVFYILFLVGSFSAAAIAQQSDPSTLTLDRIFNSRDFTAERFGPARWHGEGGYTTLEPSAGSTGARNDARDIIRYDATTGKRSVLIASTQLIPKGDSKPLPIDDYIWSADGNRLLIYTNSQRVWRLNTRGDYWVLDRKTDKLSKFGGDAKPSTLMFAQFSPDGSKLAYVRESNVYVENVDDHKITQLTKDGTVKLINGTFDWVYEEEFGLHDGFRWSPDGKHIAYWQIDASGIPDYYLINDTESLYPKLTPIPYPKAGQMNPAAKVGVVAADGGNTVWLRVSGDERNQYIPSMDWAGNSDEVMIQVMNRLQNNDQVMLGDIRTGDVRTVLAEKDDTWVDVRREDLRWINNGSQFTWLSERDGWRHMYVVSRDGKSTKLVTKFDFDVIDVENVDEKNGWVYFSASPDNATQTYLYRIKLDGSTKPERLTPMDQAGSHSYDVSPQGDFAFHTYSTFVSPPRIELINLPKHDLVRPLSENKDLRAKVAQLKHGPIEFFKVDGGDGVKLDGWMIKPPDFDPSKKYPLFFYVYGEPASQTVTDKWGNQRFLWHLMLAQQGYLVASVDNRGTPAPRGREWRKSIYRKIGVIASDEQASAAKEMSKWPYVDSSRIGIWGWSGGGSMTLNMMFRYPDIYKTGMSVAPVTDIHYYDTIYQERYMGLPQQNEEDYKRSSPITFAEHLKGNLLLVHGSGDDNVHFQNSEALINKMIALNKTFTMMDYPNRTHGISEGRGTTLHLYSLLTRYLHENLPAGPAK